jgi:hypothetical protein
MLPTDMEIHATIKRFLDHAEMPLADAKVSAAINDSDTKTPTDKPARSGNSVVIFTTNENLTRLFEALEENREVALGDTSRRDLDTIARQVLRGEALLNLDMAARLLLLLAGEDNARPKPPAKLLTPRQLDVVKLLAQGKNNQEIAQEALGPMSSVSWPSSAPLTAPARSSGPSNSASSRLTLTSNSVLHRC